MVGLPDRVQVRARHSARNRAKHHPVNTKQRRNAHVLGTVNEHRLLATPFERFEQSRGLLELGRLEVDRQVQIFEPGAPCQIRFVSERAR